MGAPDVLARLSALGVQLSREGEAIRAAPRSALTDQARDLIRAHKAELLAALANEGDRLPDPVAEARRQRVVAMLRESPRIRYAVVVDNPDTDPVIVALGIRGQATCELRVPLVKFDPFLLLDLIERHGATVH